RPVRTDSVHRSGAKPCALRDPRSSYPEGYGKSRFCIVTPWSNHNQYSFARNETVPLKFFKICIWRKARLLLLCFHAAKFRSSLSGRKFSETKLAVHDSYSRTHECNEPCKRAANRQKAFVPSGYGGLC